jgi:hypothetical protein
MTDSGGVARKEQGAGGCTAPAVDDMPSIYTTRNLEEGRTQLQNLVSMPMHMFKTIDSLLCSSAQLGLTPVFLLSRFTTARTGKPSTSLELPQDYPPTHWRADLRAVPR